MRPEIIVLVGDFISQRNSEKLPYDSFKSYFDTIQQIVKDNEYKCLRDQTHWIFVPSLEDPGQTKLMPCLPLSDYLFSGARGTATSKVLKNFNLASNPLRISYYGKEIVISRFNFYKKMKKNHLAKV
jgi:DNA polymerase alpha/epsilon subunit B